jgi:hypothetical protein
MKIFKKCKQTLHLYWHKRYYHSEIDRDFQSYLHQFQSINNMQINNVLDLIHSKEYLLGNYFLYKKNYEAACQIFNEMKVHLRGQYIASHLYCIVLRRLGISKLKLNSHKEGLLEFDNIYEYSKNKIRFDESLHSNSVIELLKTYLLYNSKKGGYILTKFNKGLDHVDINTQNQALFQYYNTVI